MNSSKLNCIISITSYPKRFSTLHLCLGSLLRQSFTGDGIILYLDNDVPKSEIPRRVVELTKLGLKIIVTDDALKCHTKYYYSMQDFPDAVIITVDDDVIYDYKCIETLYASYLHNPYAVSANRVHKMLRYEDGSLKPYLDWKFEETQTFTPSFDLFATGVGGILYPPHLMPEIMFNKRYIKEHCLYTDDIWLKFMEQINKVPVVYTGMVPPHPKQIPGTKENALYPYNSANGLNDLCIKTLNQLFAGLL